jgi:hypothetical protein
MGAEKGVWSAAFEFRMVEGGVGGRGGLEDGGWTFETEMTQVNAKAGKSV